MDTETGLLIGAMLCVARIVVQDSIAGKPHKEPTPPPAAVVIVDETPYQYYPAYIPYAGCELGNVPYTNPEDAFITVPVDVVPYHRSQHIWPH